MINDARIITIHLDAAQSAKEINYAGHSMIIIEASNDEASINVERVYQNTKLNRLPMRLGSSSKQRWFDKFVISHPAQAGSWVKIAVWGDPDDYNDKLADIQHAHMIGNGTPVGDFDFYEGHVTTSGSATLHTVAANTKAIIRDMAAFGYSPHYSFYVAFDVVMPDGRHINNKHYPSQEWYKFHNYIGMVLEAGTIINVAYMAVSSPSLRYKLLVETINV